MRDIEFTLNGQKKSLRLNPLRRLIDVLREDLGATGVKEGCGEGECGACSILLNGRIVDSCILAAGAIEGADVMTIEAVRETELGKHIVDGFAAEGAVQCGFCIPGMIVAAYTLLERNTKPTEEEIRHGIAGNLCRCTGYQSIVAAVQFAAAQHMDSRQKIQGTPAQ